MRLDTWLYKNRTRLGYGLQDLSARANVSIGAISRIENNKTQPALVTVVRLASALDFSVEDFSETFSLRLARKTPDFKQPHPYLSVGEVVRFASLTKENRDDLFRILDFWFGYVAQKNRMFNENRKRYNSEKIRDMLAMGDDAIPYPPNFSVHDLEKIYSWSGPMFFPDVGFYVRRIRNLRLHTLSTLQYELDLSDSSLVKIERGDVELLKFDDALKLNTFFNDEGLFWGFCWEVASLLIYLQNALMRIPKDIENRTQDRNAVYNLLKIERWLWRDDAHADFAESVRKYGFDC